LVLFAQERIAKLLLQATEILACVAIKHAMRHPVAAAMSA
jgi:hypothetical protein